MSEQNKNQIDTDSILVRCWVDRGREAVITQADFAAMFRAHRTHAARWQDVRGSDELHLLDLALAAATLHLAALPPDEFVAWTLNLHDPPLNLFVSGDNTGFRVTGRAYLSHVRTAGHGRLYFESQRPRREVQRSVLDVEGRDVLNIYEQFFHRSVQLPTRLIDLGGTNVAFVQGLPRVDRDWLANLDAAQVAALLAGGTLENVEERHYRFACSCNQETILKVVRGMFLDKAEELFEDDDKVETLCPRCGRKWWISRDEFDEGRVGSA
ncbi:MAG: Hsp33 family molecular chaperone HslO [Deltaproteobacteria bacterium]|nr:Hsp33 family molecular chaperone HslO [Deltaproteobacteria bacterium]